MPGSFKLSNLYPVKHRDIFGNGHIRTLLVHIRRCWRYLSKFNPLQNAMIRYFHETLYFQTSRLSGDQWNVEKVESAVRLVPDSVRQCKH